MRDLDMSDVLADARDMLDQHLMQMYNKLDKYTDSELEEFRYWARIRAHDEGDIYELRAIDDILLRRHSTLCEGCLGRYGCEMCCPSYFDPMDDIPYGTPDSWIPDNPDANGMRQSDFI